MEEKIIRSLGIDLSPGFASISYMEEKGSVPVSMSICVDDEKYMIPMLLYKKENTGEWLAGDEAGFAAENGRPENLADRIDLLFQQQEVKYIEGKEYSGETLLQEYIRILFRKARERIGFTTVNHIIVTSDSPDIRLKHLVSGLFQTLGFAKEKIHVKTHTETYVSYVLCNKREIWANDVTLFRMDENEFICQNITKRRVKNGLVIFVEEENLTGRISYNMLKTKSGREQADDILLSYLQEDYKTHIVSCVFFTGTGFYDNWYRKSAAEICRRRKAFKGMNLFADGAAVSIQDEEYKDILILCEGKTLLNIGILIEKEGNEEEFSMLRAGQSWTESHNSQELIVDDISHVSLVISSPFQEERQLIEVDFDEFPQRRDKTMCIEVELGYVNEKSFEITISDKGFGPFFASSGKKIRKRISL